MEHLWLVFNCGSERNMFSDIALGAKLTLYLNTRGDFLKTWANVSHQVLAKNWIEVKK